MNRVESSVLTFLVVALLAGQSSRSTVLYFGLVIHSLWQSSISSCTLLHRAHDWELRNFGSTIALADREEPCSEVFGLRSTVFIRCGKFRTIKDPKMIRRLFFVPTLIRTVCHFEVEAAAKGLSMKEVTTNDNDGRSLMWATERRHKDDNHITLVKTWMIPAKFCLLFEVVSPMSCPPLSRGSLNFIVMLQLLRSLPRYVLQMFHTPSFGLARFGDREQYFIRTS